MYAFTQTHERLNTKEIWSQFQITAVWQAFRKINLARSNWSTSLSDVSEGSKDSSTPSSNATNLWLLLTYWGGDKISAGITWDLCNNRKKRDYSIHLNLVFTWGEQTFQILFTLQHTAKEEQFFGKKAGHKKQVHKQVLAVALHDRTRKNKNNSLTQLIQTELYLSLSTQEKKPKLSHAIPSQGDA